MHICASGAEYRFSGQIRAVRFAAAQYTFRNRHFAARNTRLPRRPQLDMYINIIPQISPKFSPKFNPEIYQNSTLCFGYFAPFSLCPQTESAQNRENSQRFDRSAMRENAAFSARNKTFLLRKLTFRGVSGIMALTEKMNRGVSESRSGCTIII